MRAGCAEALRNIRAAPFLFGTLTVLIALLTGGAIFADHQAVHGILERERAFLAAGGDLLRVSGRAGQQIDAAACAALAHLGGVRGAAAVSIRQARLVGRPDHTQTVIVATPGFTDLVDTPALGAGEVLIASALQERWDLDVSGYLALTSAATGLADWAGAWTPPPEAQRIAGVVDLATLGDAATTAVVLPEPALGEAAECIVRTDPQALASVEAALPAALGESPGNELQVQRQVFVGEFGPDPTGDFAARPTRLIGLAVGGVVGVLLALVSWTRRQRAALYATLGLKYVGGVGLRFVESAYPAVTGIAWGAIWATLAASVAGLDPSVAAPSSGLQALGATGVALAITALVSLWRSPTLAALKDR